jgi:hypothetical protein
VEHVYNSGTALGRGRRRKENDRVNNIENPFICVEDGIMKH